MTLALSSAPCCWEKVNPVRRVEHVDRADLASPQRGQSERDRAGVRRRKRLGVAEAQVAERDLALETNACLGLVGAADLDLFVRASDADETLSGRDDNRVRDVVLNLRLAPARARPWRGIDKRLIIIRRSVASSAKVHHRDDARESAAGGDRP